MSSQSCTCKYCGKNYSCLASLTHHQKHAKHCLELQSKYTTIICEYCNKSFANTYTLQTHLGTCKQKKELETLDILRENKVLKEQLLKQNEYITKLNEQNARLLEQISKYTQNGGQPVTTNSNNTNSNNTNSNNTTNNNYSIQFNLLFDKLTSFNEPNVVNSIKELSERQNLSQLDYTHFQKEVIKNLVENSINKFTFCTDSRRKVMVLKNQEGENIRTHLDDFLSDYINYSKGEIKGYIDNATLHMDELVNNDMLPSDDVWYSFKESKDTLEKNLKETSSSLDVKNTPIAKQIKSEITNSGVILKKK